MRKSRKPDWQQQIARERIQILFNLAEKEYKKHPDRSKRYVELAKKIGLKYNVRLPKELKRKFCENCHAFLKPGTNCIFRLDSRRKIKTLRCLNCNKIYRYPYK